MAFYTRRDGTIRCDHCGAPPVPGLAACPYCRAAYPGVTAGVQCPRCRVVNAQGQTGCAGCGLGITRACVFCQHVSPLDAAACRRCREPFEGAEDRLRAQQAAQRRQQYLGLASQGLGAAVTVATHPTGARLLSSLFRALTDD